MLEDVCVGGNNKAKKPTSKEAFPGVYSPRIDLFSLCCVNEDLDIQQKINLIVLELGLKIADYAEILDAYHDAGKEQKVCFFPWLVNHPYIKFIMQCNIYT